MYITRVRLQDIKSHAEADFVFSQGTTAITGANGAGKTTIIEAISWALFDLLDYKREDFMRRGARKGVVRISFQSRLDEREYVVYRDTGTGYYVFDEAVNARVADKKEEVAKFLRMHFGIEPGTDLEKMFRAAIGVPQGTFTAIFLQTPAVRKAEFDKLLKVEEYRRGADKLLETDRYIRQKSAAVQTKIAVAENEISRLDALETNFETLKQRAAELAAQQTELQNEIEQKSAAATEFEQNQAELKKLEIENAAAVQKLENAERWERQKAAELSEAERVAERQTVLQADFDAHKLALGELAALEIKQTERLKFQEEAQKNEREIIASNAEIKRLQENIKKAAAARNEIEQLAPQIERQKELETTREQLRNALAAANAAQAQLKTHQAQVDALRTQFLRQRELINTARANKEKAELFNVLTERELVLTQELANLRAAVERDRKFQTEVSNGLCPILSQKCLNLREGETLETYFRHQFSENTAHISRLEAEKADISKDLRESREAEKIYTGLPKLEERQSEIQTEGIRLREESERLEKASANLATLENDLRQTEDSLRELRNPRERAEQLRREAEREAVFQAEFDLEKRRINELETEKSRISNELAAFATLDELLREFRSKRDTSKNAHDEFVRGQSLAESVGARRENLSKAANETTQFREAAENIASELGKAREKYNAEAHQTLRFALENAKLAERETTTELRNTKQSENEHRLEIERLHKIFLTMQTDFKEKNRLDKVGETTDFIRDTLKKAAPEVAKLLLHSISLEANELFREITGSASRTLHWREDYEIIMEEDGYERPFATLSGGEQMAAALCVRLALLKNLSDIRLAFFDEPTTNMDAQRREKLAEQIGKIKNFDQLFVISHDDSFDQFVDNIVSL